MVLTMNHESLTMNHPLVCLARAMSLPLHEYAPAVFDLGREVVKVLCIAYLNNKKEEKKMKNYVFNGHLGAFF